MRPLNLGWLPLCGLLFCALAAAQNPTVQALDECIGKLEASEQSSPPGLGGIRDQCPDLKSVLEHSPVATWLPEDWWGSLFTADSLKALRELIEHEPERSSRALDTSGVSAALASLGEEPDDQLSWWERLREWLRSRLQTDSQDEPGWLYKWMEELAEHETALRVIAYTLFGLIVLSVVLIVLNELRAAGVFGARWKRAGESTLPALSAGSAAALTLEDVERSDPAFRPSKLLALLLAVLARREDRAVDGSFTHRELAARVSLDDDWQRSAFTRLARCAEQVRYAAALPSRIEIDEAVSGGRRLFEAIARAPGTSAA